MPDPIQKLSTRCLICQQEFQGLPLAIPILGQAPDREAAGRVEQLKAHLAHKHQQHTSLLVAFNVLMQFESQDPVIQAMREQSRASLHHMTRQPPMPDEALRESVDALFTGVDGVPAKSAVLEFVTQLRDALQEVGRYAPQSVPVQSPNGLKA